MSPPDSFRDLQDWALTRPGLAWLAPLVDEARQLLASDMHGDLPRWRAALEELPATEPLCDGSLDTPRLGAEAFASESLRATLLRLHPWRKGPLQLGGVIIDSEWRSDWKWRRIAPHLDLRNQVVLDAGCGNGYFGWRMLDAGAECVIGVDPTLVFVMQWLACRHFAGRVHNYVLPFGIERLPEQAACFDTAFSMGVLYHRKHPQEHLLHLRRLLRPGGRIVLETLVIQDDEPAELLPRGRYARMRNVWSIPSLPLLQRWLEQAGLGSSRVLDVTVTTPEEQRSTGWMQFESLSHCLDPQDPGRTVEGYPAPCRAALLIETPG